MEKNVTFCTPSLSGPTAPYIEALEASVPLIQAAGWKESYAQEVGCPYISASRANMTRKALDAGATTIIYIDYDLTWDPKDLLTLLETEGDVVAGTYRYKEDEERYMGSLRCDEDGFPIIRESDGALQAGMAPAGFLKVTKNALIRFAKAYPELLYGDPFNYALDLFNHGAINGVWWGEDYAFCMRWLDKCGEIWTPPNLNLNHYSKERDILYRGNLHEFLLKQDGGSNHVETH